jgi:hypothetical protein
MTLNKQIAAVGLVLTALAVPALSSAKSDKVDGVRADLKRGTLRVRRALDQRQDG